MRVVVAWLFTLLFTLPVMAQNMITGRVDVPPELRPRLDQAGVTSLFGASLADLNAEGRFYIPASQPGDMDLLFVKNTRTDEIILMGYTYDDIVNVGIDGTALAMLLMFNPAVATLDLNSKKSLLEAYRDNPSFPQLRQAVLKTVTNQGNVTTPDDHRVTQLVSDIVNATPQTRQNNAMIDPVQLMMH